MILLQEDKGSDVFIYACIGEESSYQTIEIMLQKLEKQIRILEAKKKIERD